MTDRPIDIPASRIPALLDGRMTQYRVPLKPQPDPDLPIGGAEFVQMGDDPGRWCWLNGWDGSIIAPFDVPHAIGDRLFPAMPIPSLNSNYCADTHGHIWSRARDGETWRRLKPARTSKGYQTVTPAHEGKYRTRFIHRLVAEAYYGPAPEGMNQVRHLNGNQLDNSPNNLDWGSGGDNWTDRQALRRGIGEEHSSAKLTRAQAEKIKASSEPQRVLAKRYGVAQATIWEIRAGRTWQDEYEAAPPNFPRRFPRITLTVTDLAVHRVQHITARQVAKEGGPLNPMICFDWFCDLYNTTHGPGAWERNDWVLARTFRVDLCNIDQMEEAT